jgi:hypothetical protein
MASNSEASAQPIITTLVLIPEGKTALVLDTSREPPRIQ